MDGGVPQATEKRETTGKRGRKWLWLAIAGASGLASVGLVWWSASSRHHGVEKIAAAATPQVTAPAAAARPAMPSLQEADATVRKLAAGISSSAIFARWLKVDDLARRFVATVDKVADGESPRTILDFMAPHGHFATVQRHGHAFVSERTWKRYDAVAEVFGSLDTGATARAYSALHPLLTAAYAEFGTPDSTLDARLSEAIQRLENTPVPKAPVEVVASGAIYKFADANLESLSPASKHLLRMGPHNEKIIQDKLRELSAALHLSPIASADTARVHHS